MCIIPPIADSRKGLQKFSHFLAFFLLVFICGIAFFVELCYIYFINQLEGFCMSERRNRYNQLQQIISLALIGAFLLFIFYLIAAGNEIIWLKVVLSILIFIVCLATIAYLYMTKELLRPRSIWMTLAAAAIVLCLLLSLILHFPSPNPRNFPAPEILACVVSTI